MFNRYMNAITMHHSSIGESPKLRKDIRHIPTKGTLYVRVHIKIIP